MKFAVAQASAFEFAPGSVFVIDAASPMNAGAIFHKNCTDEARKRWQEKKDAYDNWRAPDKNKNSIAKSKRRPANPGEFRTPKANTLTILSIEDGNWFTVSVRPPEPPPIDEWDWKAEPYVPEDDEDDEEF